METQEENQQNFETNGVVYLLSNEQMREEAIKKTNVWLNVISKSGSFACISNHNNSSTSKSSSSSGNGDSAFTGISIKQVVGNNKQKTPADILLNLQACIEYLDSLRMYLPIQAMNDPPASYPPKPQEILANSSIYHNVDGDDYSEVSSIDYSAVSGEDIVYQTSTNNRNSNTKSTPYVFETIESVIDECIENNANNATSMHLDEPMLVRRLVIRIITCLSELLFSKANYLEKNRNSYESKRSRGGRHSRSLQMYWVDGAQAYTHSFSLIQKALEISDFAYATFLQRDAEEQVNLEKERNEIIEDVNAVNVAMSHFIRNRDKYKTKVEKRMWFLQAKLEPQWSSRDDIKRRIGKERWENNPNPKHEYSRLRAKDEAELRDLKETMNRLALLDNNSTLHVLQRSEAILQELGSAPSFSSAFSTRDGDELSLAAMMEEHNLNDESTSAHHGTVDSNGVSNNIPTQRPAEQKNRSKSCRYNSIRPNYENLRVSYDLYPDPAQYSNNWKFTGSSSENRVEFFEAKIGEKNEEDDDDEILYNNGKRRNNDILVKLDFFYATGTVITVLDHPTQGKSRLFSCARDRHLDPDLYKQILDNPAFARARTSRPHVHGPRPIQSYTNP